MSLINSLPFFGSVSDRTDHVRVEPTFGDAHSVFPRASSTEHVSEGATSFETVMKAMQSATVGDQTAMRMATYYRGVRLIAEAISTMPLLLLNNQDGKWVDLPNNHPVKRLFCQQPNRRMGPKSFLSLSAAYMINKGDGLSRIVRSKGKPIALIPMDRDAVDVKELRSGDIQYVWHRPDNGRLILSQDDVLHFRNFSLDGICGQSTLSYARNAITLAGKIRQHAVNLFETGTNLGSVVEVPGQLSDSAKINLSDGVQKFKGTRNTGGTLVLEEAATYKNVGITASDAQFIEQAQFSRQEIAIFLGIPPHMLGDTTKQSSWGAGLEQMSIGFVQYTLNPYLVEIEQAIHRTFFDGDPDIKITFKRDELTRGDALSRAQANDIRARNGVINANEWRVDDGLNERDDPGGQEYNRPANTNGDLPPVQQEGEDDVSESTD